MPSIKDVARLAGVSIATVSRAVNGLDVVSEATRGKIDAAIRKIGYNPNLMARSLKNGSARLLGLLVPDIENPYYATLAKHIEVEARIAGYNLVLCNTGGRKKLEAHYVDLLAGKFIDGILLCRSSIRAANAPGDRLDSVPAVILEKSDVLDRRPTVMVDNFAVGRLVAEHFLDNGHRNFVCVVEDRGLFPFARRLEGFGSVLSASGVRFTNMVIEAGGALGEENAKGLMRRLKSSAKSRPTAVYCTNDQLAFGVMQAILKSGLKIPGDVSVAGTDNVPQSSYTFPPLTTVKQPFGDIAASAIRMLLGKGRERGGEVVVAPELVARQSTGPAAFVGGRAGRRVPLVKKGPS